MERHTALSSCRLEELGSEQCRHSLFPESRLCCPIQVVPQNSHINYCLFIWLQIHFWEIQPLIHSLGTSHESIYLTHNRPDRGSDTPGPLPVRWRTECQRSTVVIGNVHLVGSFSCSFLLGPLPVFSVHRSLTPFSSQLGKIWTS